MEALKYFFIISTWLANYDGVLATSTGEVTIYDSGDTWNPQTACPGGFDALIDVSGTYGSWGIPVPSGYVSYGYDSYAETNKVAFDSYLNQIDKCPNSQSKQFSVEMSCHSPETLLGSCNEQFFGRNGGFPIPCCSNGGLTSIKTVYYAGWNDVSDYLNTLITPSATAITALQMAGWDGYKFTKDPCPGTKKQFTIRWTCKG